MKTFILHMPKGAINQKTLVNGKLIKSEIELCEVMKGAFCQINKCKSLTDWANQLNKSGEYEGTFTKHDALDSMSSLFNLAIDGHPVSIYSFYLQHNHLN